MILIIFILSHVYRLLLKFLGIFEGSKSKRPQVKMHLNKKKKKKKKQNKKNWFDLILNF